MIVECELCNAYVEASVHGNFERLSDGSGPSILFSLLRCNKCRSPILIEQNNIGNLAEGDIWDSPRRIFPASKYRPNPQTLQKTFRWHSMKHTHAIGIGHTQQQPYSAAKPLKVFAKHTTSMNAILWPR